MPYDDLFTFFRWALSWIVTIYASIITLQSLYGWYVWLSGGERYISIVRQYVIVCALLCVIFLIMWHAHHVLDGTRQVWDEVKRANARFASAKV